MKDTNLRLDRKDRKQRSFKYNDTKLGTLEERERHQKQKEEK